MPEIQSTGIPSPTRLDTLRAGPLKTRLPKASQSRSDEQLVAAVGGQVVETGLIRIERFYTFTESWGNTQLNIVQDLPRLPGQAHIQPWIYIDTETTGLAGGSGTLAFLVGIAVIEEHGIRMTQLLMTRYAAETQMLSLLEKCLPDDHGFVSYNGKSYDLPLLLTRFRMQGLENACLTREHLDLLHPTRRLFSKCWQDCRLATLETKLLDFYRYDDLPGSEAPEAWFNYLRNGQSRKLIQVVKHNQYDIITLAVAHAVLGRCVKNPQFYRVDHYNLARWLCETDESRAIALLESRKASLCGDGKRLLAHLYRRHSRWDEAIILWESLAKQGCIESLERLAKYHEHVSNDLLKAWHYCSQLPGSKADRKRLERVTLKMRQRNISLCECEDTTGLHSAESR